MAPIKFEENMRDKLEKRTVVPSGASWSKLSQRLDAENKRNRKSSFWWFGIAASVAAILFVSITYFNNNEEGESIVPVLVEEKVEELIKETNTINKEQPTEVIANVTPEIEEKKETIKEETPKVNVPQKKILKAVESIETSVASVNNGKKELNQNVGEQNNITKNIIDPEELNNNITKAIAEVKTKNLEVTDQQIDSLLKSAHQDILKSRILKKKNNVVDANLLLQGVEEDLGQSFRTKIFETLKDGAKKAKTAIADRNN